jgi:membrane-associated phospholipid phosphatase
MARRRRLPPPASLSQAPFWRSPHFANTLAICALLIVTLDRPVSEAMRTAAPWVIEIFRVLTDLGKSDGWLWISGLLAIALGWVRWAAVGRMKRALTGWGAQASLFFFVAVAGSGIVINVLKAIFGRARPRMLERHELYGFEPLTVDPDFHSFPSGHANTLAAVALVLGLFFPRYRVPLLVAGIALGFSRVFVNAHYVSDVIAGIAVAVVTTLWLRDLCARRGWVFVLDRNGFVRLAPAGRLLRLEARRRLRMLWNGATQRLSGRPT